MTYTVAATEVTDAETGQTVTVSTISLPNGTYETLIFPGSPGNSFRELRSDRYLTREAARLGHARMTGQAALDLASGDLTAPHRAAWG